MNNFVEVLIKEIAKTNKVNADNYDEVDDLYAYLGYDLELDLIRDVGVESTSDLMELLKKI